MRKTGADVIIAPSADLPELLSNSEWSFAPPLPEDEGKQILYKRYLTRKSEYKFKTGDVIAFATYDGFSLVKNYMRRLSKAVTHTQYTHVALVIVMKDDCRDDETVFMVEATTNPAETVDATNGSGKKRNGTWCFAAPERIFSDPAEMWHIPLKCPLSEEQEGKLLAWAGKQYQLDPCFDKNSMFGAGFDALDSVGSENKKDDFSLLFCSEFVSSCYKMAGLFDKYYKDPEAVNCSEQTPSDVANYPWFAKDDIFQLKMKGEYHESDEAPGGHEHVDRPENHRPHSHSQKTEEKESDQAESEPVPEDKAEEKAVEKSSDNADTGVTMDDIVVEQSAEDAPEEE